jgi:CDP-diacylglycerol--glycerol-3-phosphate 3-phosphatidyltransferase
MNIANKLTLLRIAFIPVFIAFFYINIKYQYHYAALVFILASITDGIDGSLARKHDIVTDFGRLIDPIADKLLVCSALIMLMTRPELFKVSAIVVIILIGREFIVSGFRLLAASKGKVVAADQLGKIKMVVQIVAICFVLVEGGIVEGGLLVQWNMPSDWPIIGTMLIGQILMWASAALAVASMINYFVKNKEILKTLF